MRAGIPSSINGFPVRLTASSTTGISMTRPISKNIGSPISAATRAIAHGSAAPRALPSTVSTIWSAPPESASSLPSIAPSAIRMPTEATVLPTPLEKLLISFSTGIPAARPSTSEPSTSDRNGCSFTLVISTTITAMATTVAPISRVSWPVQAAARTDVMRAPGRRSTRLR